MNPRNWQRLSIDQGGRTVLAVHFEAGRGEAGFGELAELLPGHTVFEAAPAGLDARFGPGAEPPDYVRHWLDDIRSAGAEVAGVLGYCAGAPLACALRERIAEEGLGRPPVVLLDPSAVTPEMIHTQFTQATGSFARFLPEPEVKDALAMADDALEATRAGRDIGEMAADLGRAYRELAHRPCELLGVEPALAEQLCDRFDAFLAYLLASWRAAARPAGDGATLVRSRDHDETYGVGHGGVVIDVPHGALLRDPRCADAVVAAMRTGGGAPPGPSDPDDDLGTWLREVVAATLNSDPAAIDPRRPLVEFGLDSVDSAQLCGLVEERFGVEIEPSAAWEFPTLAEFADFVRRTCGAAAPAAGSGDGGTR